MLSIQQNNITFQGKVSKKQRKEVSQKTIQAQDAFNKSNNIKENKTKKKHPILKKIASFMALIGAWFLSLKIALNKKEEKANNVKEVKQPEKISTDNNVQIENTTAEDANIKQPEIRQDEDIEVIQKEEYSLAPQSEEDLEEAKEEEINRIKAQTTQKLNNEADEIKKEAEEIQKNSLKYIDKIKDIKAEAREIHDYIQELEKDTQQQSTEVTKTMLKKLQHKGDKIELPNSAKLTRISENGFTPEYQYTIYNKQKEPVKITLFGENIKEPYRIILPLKKGHFSQIEYLGGIGKKRNTFAYYMNYTPKDSNKMAGKKMYIIQDGRVKSYEENFEALLFNHSCIKSDTEYTFNNQKGTFTCATGVNKSAIHGTYTEEYEYNSETNELVSYTLAPVRRDESTTNEYKKRYEYKNGKLSEYKEDYSKKRDNNEHLDKKLVFSKDGNLERHSTGIITTPEGIEISDLEYQFENQELSKMRTNKRRDINPYSFHS